MQNYYPHNTDPSWEKRLKNVCRPAPAWKRQLWRLSKQAFGVVLLVTLPFFVLIRGSVFLYTQYHWHTWLALLGSAAAASVVVLGYLILVYRWAAGRWMVDKQRLKHQLIASGLVVLCYSGFQLFSWPDKNTGPGDVATEFRQLHPFLRLAVGTVLLLDGDIIATDFSREHDDYRKMGLPPKAHSLHFVQPSTGYAHAMDLRTRGRWGIRNWLLKSYFRLMGFNTLRHVGTGDHLHVSLSVHDRPGAI